MTVDIISVSEGIIRSAELERRLNAAVFRLTSDDATISDCIETLRLLAQMDDVRHQGPSALVMRALQRFDARTRVAPPEALNGTVREASQTCGWHRCWEQVAPWQGVDGEWCSDECFNADMRERP